MKKRVSAVLLSIVLCLSLFSVAAAAAETPSATITGATKGKTSVTVKLTGLPADTAFVGTVSATKGGELVDTPTIFTAMTDENGNATVENIVCPALEQGMKVSVSGSTPGNAVELDPKNGSTTVGGGSSGGGGGGGGSSSNVNITPATNGKVTVSPSNPAEGDKVTVTVTPDAGYRLDKLTVKDKDGNELALTKVSDTEYTFTMPAGKVTITATFVKGVEMKFTDVPANAYYYDAVLWAIENGVTEGTSATTFSPNASCTRAQMVTFLWRTAGSPAPDAGTKNPFTDVPTGVYYYDAVLWAVEKGVTVGTSATTFSPNAAVTRGQTVTFIHRAKGSPAPAGTNAFTDVAASAYYAAAVNWAVGAQVTNGTSATTFSPAKNCTRAQIVTFLYRAK